MTGWGADRRQRPDRVVWGLQEGCRRVARRFLLGELRAVRCWGGKMSSARAGGQVTSAVGRSRQDCAYTPTKCLSPLNHWDTPTHINNGQLISSVWLSAAFLIPIHDSLGSIPRPPLGLKWDDMGFFMSTKIGGILAFALGKISRARPWVYLGCEPLWTVWQRKLPYIFSFLCFFFLFFFFVFLHRKCHCCDLYLSPSALHDG